MRPKLKEEPREWLKFTASTAVVLTGLTVFFWFRGSLAPEAALVLLLVLGGGLAGAFLRPRLVRGYYRAGMTLGFWIGQIMGRVMLTLLFWLVLTPLSVLLRLMRKDLLETKLDPGAKSYWRKSTWPGRFDQSF
jgi:hypothetical protein